MITEIKEFLFDPLWYHGINLILYIKKIITYSFNIYFKKMFILFLGGNGVNSDHALGKFFIYQKEDSLVNPNKWDYYKNPCNNYDD